MSSQAYHSVEVLKFKDGNGVYMYHIPTVWSDETHMKEAKGERREGRTIRLDDEEATASA